MKICLLFISIIILFSVIQMNAQNKIPSKETNVDYPWVPRVSALVAYVKYKAGKAIILHGGGQTYSKRHISMAFNMDYPDEKKEKLLAKFPKEGIDIFTYCY